MLTCLLRRLRIKASHELLIVEHLLLHPGVFAPYRTEHHGGSHTFLHLPRRAHSNGAVDHRQPGPIFSYVARGGTDEITNLEGIADMQNRAGRIDYHWRYVNTLAFVTSFQYCEQRPSNFSQAHYNYGFFRHYFLSS